MGGIREMILDQNTELPILCKSFSFLAVPGWMFAVPLWLAWRLKILTRWTPPISVESLLHGSKHDGLDAARDCGFDYSSIEDVFR